MGQVRTLAETNVFRVGLEAYFISSMSTSEKLSCNRWSDHQPFSRAITTYQIIRYPILYISVDCMNLIKALVKRLYYVFGLLDFRWAIL